MIWVVFLGLFLVCAGMTVVFLVYLCMLWYAALRLPPEGPAGVEERNKEAEKGLSTAELERLEDGGGGWVAAGECAVCLEEMEPGQAARVLPACRHAFHRTCADRWLTARPVCPLCRAHPLPPPASPPPHQPQEESIPSLLTSLEFGSI